MSRLRDDESGFTLIELLVTLAISMVVMGAILGLLDMSLRSSASSLGRSQAVRDGRGAIDRVGQELRRATCPDAGPAVLAATDDSVTYFVSRPQSDYRLAPVAERHTLTYSASGGTITLTVLPGTTGTPAPTRQTVLGMNLSRTGTTPIFQYRSYDTTSTSDTSLIAAPVAAESLSSIGQVQVTFTALGAYPNATQG
jgi:prepilin-type N-terminal cleavage/methylation domain-containing protein